LGQGVASPARLLKIFAAIRGAGDQFVELPFHPAGASSKNDAWPVSRIQA
jgi:hypothetical protein